MKLKVIQLYSKNIILILLIVLTSNFLQSQNSSDKLYLNNKEVLNGKVLRIDATNIEFDPDGSIPFLIIKRSDVNLLIYSDNTIVDFNSESEIQRAIPTSNKTEVTFNNIPEFVFKEGMDPNPIVVGVPGLKKGELVEKAKKAVFKMKKNHGLWEDGIYIISFLDPIKDGFEFQVNYKDKNFVRYNHYTGDPIRQSLDLTFEVLCKEERYKLSVIKFEINDIGSMKKYQKLYLFKNKNKTVRKIYRTVVPMTEAFFNKMAGELYEGIIEN